MPANTKSVKVPFVRPPQEAMNDDLKRAFICYEDEPGDTQKAIYAIAYLMDWAGQVGNADVDGFAVYGLAKLLRQCADRVGHLFTQEDVIAMGGDIRNPKAPR